MNKDENIGRCAGTLGFIISDNENQLGLNGYEVKLTNIGNLTYMPNEVEICVDGIEIETGNELAYMWNM